MTEVPALLKAPLLDMDRPYEEVAAEYQALQEKQSRLWALDRWRDYQAAKAVPHLAADFLNRGDQPIPDHLGVTDPLVTRRAAAVEQPLEGCLRLDEGALHPPERALADLLPKRNAGVLGVDVNVGHARDSEAVPAAGQPRADAEKAPAGSSLPAVASFW